MADKSVDIKITTRADSTGAEQAKQDIRDVGQEAEKTANQTADIGRKLDLGNLIAAMQVGVSVGLELKEKIEQWRDAIREADVASYSAVSGLIAQREAFNSLIERVKTAADAERGRTKLIAEQNEIRAALFEARIREDAAVIEQLEAQSEEIARQVERYETLAAAALDRAAVEKSITEAYKEQEKQLAGMRDQAAKLDEAQASLLAKLDQADFGKLDRQDKLDTLRTKLVRLRDELSNIFGPDAQLATPRSLVQALDELPLQAREAATKAVEELLKIEEQYRAIENRASTAARPSAAPRASAAPTGGGLTPRQQWDAALAAGDINLANQISAANPGAITGPSGAAPSGAPPALPTAPAVPSAPAAGATGGSGASGLTEAATTQEEASRELKASADKLKSAGQGILDATGKIATAADPIPAAIDELGNTIQEGFRALDARITAVDARISEQINQLWTQVNLLWSRV